MNEEKIQSIVESIIDIQPDPAEEIVTAITFPGVDFIFQISREETYEGEWIFRIYNFTLDRFDEIAELKYAHLHKLLRKAFITYEDGDMLSLKVQINELMYHWKPQEFKIKTKVRNQHDGVNIKPEE